MRRLVSIRNSCMECDEAITNPLCPECLARGMRVMVGEQNQKLSRQIAGFSTSGETHCIRCGKEVGLCAHCFSKDIYEFLSGKNKRIAQEFLGNFDFGLRESLVGY